MKWWMLCVHERAKKKKEGRCHLEFWCDPITEPWNLNWFLSLECLKMESWDLKPPQRPVGVYVGTVTPKQRLQRLYTTALSKRIKDFFALMMILVIVTSNHKYIVLQSLICRERIERMPKKHTFHFLSILWDWSLLSLLTPHCGLGLY